MNTNECTHHRHVLKHAPTHVYVRTRKRTYTCSHTNTRTHAKHTCLWRTVRCIQVFFLPDGVTLGAIRIWNYNKSLLEASKGVRAARVLLRGQQVWEGELAKASGDTSTDYTTTIFFPTSEEGGDEGERALSLDQLPPLPFKSGAMDSGRLSADPGVMGEEPPMLAAQNVGGGQDGGAAAAAGASGGPLWLAGGTAESRGGGGLGALGSTLSAPLSLSGRSKMTCDLDDPDMLPPGLSCRV